MKILGRGFLKLEPKYTRKCSATERITTSHLRIVTKSCQCVQSRRVVQRRPVIEVLRQSAEGFQL